MPLFGRKKRNHEPQVDIELDELDDDVDEDSVDDQDEEADDEETDDEWSELDKSQDWRDDGPFDIDEVELEDDDTPRLDLGSVILTPFEGLQLQLQMDESTGLIQAALAMHEQSGLEVALFGSPRSGGMAREIRAEIVRVAKEAGGSAELGKGPFGTEIKRILPVQAPDGSDAILVSRVWLVEGPRWLLRGTLMGEAAMSDDDSKAYELIEFFKNLIVRRGEAPVAAGDLIGMTLPDDMRAQG